MKKKHDDYQHVLSAEKRLDGVANRTPVLTSRTLNEKLKSRVFFKCENYQRMGAFKFRGAYNAISRLTVEQQKKGVIAYSSGNHAQAVALVGRLLGVPTTVVMPRNAPDIKTAATRGYGAKVVLYDPRTEDRLEIAENLQKRTETTMIPPFNHTHILAGQGTAALELLREQADLDLLLVPCGGGGLLSGSAIAASGLCPHCRVVGIEPEAADDACRSFQTRSLQRCENPETIADGARTPSLGTITFPLVLTYASGMATVSESSIRQAVRFLFYRMKMVVEPTGAMGLAALLQKTVPTGKNIGVILSGGNIDAATMNSILNETDRSAVLPG